MHSSISAVWDGLCHISELSWNRIKHPSEVVSVGDTIEVYVKDIDTENHKVSLGYKKAEDNPLGAAEEQLTPSAAPSMLRSCP